MSKVRVYEVAKQMNVEPKALVSMFQAIGVSEVRNHMSSVDPEMVERLKRHLDKQKNHDVVEERIRPTVVKRRSVAKAADPSAATLPQARDSQPQAAVVPAAASSRAVMPAAAASTRSVAGAAPRKSAESGRLPEAPRSAVAVAAVAAAPEPPAAAASSKAVIPAAKPSAPRAAASSRRAVAEASGAGVEVIPEDRPSRRKPVAAPVSKKTLSTPRLPLDADLDDAPRAGNGFPADEVPAAAAAPVAETVREEAKQAAPIQDDVTTAPAMPAPVEPTEVRPAAHAIPAGVVSAQPQPAAAAPAPVPEREAAPAPSVPPKPKTGVEYWAGRPGVPMPTPMNAQRTGIGGGAIGAGARRVQYDPRAGGAGIARGGPMRPGMRGGAFAGRGGPGGFRGRPIPGQLRPRPQVSTKEMSEHKKLIRIEENITLQSMAQKMSLKATELMMKIFSLGMTNVHINTSLDADTAKLLANEFGWEVEDVAISEEASMAAARGEHPSTEARTEDMELRAPVVTVMGHVDHGKTSLLDRIRKAAVASGEAGGITQHIGAYKVQTPGGTVVFLDTPGHEAFSQMRARGASVTDIVILVVAADDGVMPQTKEAVAHAKAAKVPIIVAVNKIDKPGAEPERARRELVELGLQPEEWGGDTIFVNVSAQTGEGIEQLLEMVHLQSEILDLRADSTVPARGTVIEALLDRGRGPVARILVQEGTLRVGDFVLAGAGFGKIRAMTNEHGKSVHSAGPSTPVEILGLSDVPGAGDPLDAVKDAKKAQEIAETRKGRISKSMIPASAKVSLEELSKRMSDSGQQELRVIIKGDVQGSVEAVSEALSKLTGEKARLLIIHAAVGAITEGDINLAVAARAVVVGFNVKPAGKAAALADENKIEIRLYSIIYNAVDDVRAAMEGLLPSTYVEELLGKAEIRVVYTIRNRSVAGCYVIQGEIKRNALMRVVRAGASIHDGKPDQLKRFKEDVKEVKEGFECGITVEGWGDLKEGDILESYEMKEVKQKL